MEIVWSETALNSYLSTIDYLFEKWSLKEIINFENKVDNLLEHILANNDLVQSLNFLVTENVRLTVSTPWFMQS